MQTENIIFPIEENNEFSFGNPFEKISLCFERLTKKEILNYSLGVNHLIGILLCLYLATKNIKNERRNAK